MSQKRNDTSGVSDSRVSAAYRQLAQERAPESLNDAVLQTARAQRRRWWPASNPVLQPIALAAAVCFALTVVLEFSQPRVDTANADLSRLEVQAAGESQGTEAPASAALPEIRSQGLRDDAAPANRSAKFSAPPADRRCGSESRGTPADWLLCIEQLKADGFDAAAENEEALLRERFPATGLPER